MTESAFIEVPHDELVQRACDILSQERAKPRDIAWAWAFLSSLERGEAFGSEETSYRAIYELHEWMKKQGFQTFDANGMPTTPRKGVSAIKPNDIEDLMMLRVADVRSKAKAQGLAWPENQGVQVKSMRKPIQRLPLQEDLILELICSMGLDPMNLPPFKVGAHGESVKKKIRSEARKNKAVFTSEAVFENAWLRLSKQGRIKHPSSLKAPTK